MPELPEVETIRSALARLVLGKRICQVRVAGKRVIDPLTKKHIRKEILDHRFVTCLRRGKYLILQGKDFSLLFHLGMSGSLIFFPKSKTPGKHTHLLIRFHDGSELHYADPRTFGRIRFYPLLPLERIPELSRLGWEPLDGGISLSELGKAFKRRSAPIKQVIMDQRLIAGIGNIYASEILFDSSIDPWKPARDLTRPELGRLRRAMERVLSAAIDEGGTSIISFQDAEGRRGGHQNSLQVYSRIESPCPRCEGIILKRNLGGRATYYCPGCQRK